MPYGGHLYCVQHGISSTAYASLYALYASRYESVNTCVCHFTDSTASAQEGRAKEVEVNVGDAEIAAHGLQLAAQDAEIAAQELQLAAKDEELELMRARMAQLEAQLVRHHSCYRLWRM